MLFPNQKDYLRERQRKHSKESATAYIIITTTTTTMVSKQHLKKPAFK